MINGSELVMENIYLCPVMPKSFYVKRLLSLNIWISNLKKSSLFSEALKKCSITCNNAKGLYIPVSCNFKKSVCVNPEANIHPVEDARVYRTEEQKCFQ